MKNTFEQQIYEIFGTTDPKELRKLSKDANQYQQLAKKEALRHAAGRKPAFSLPQIIQMAAMQQQGKSIAEIARTFQVSRQTVYNQIARAHCFSTDPDVKTRMCFLYRDQLCTTIDIDFRHEKIAIQNYTKKIPLRAFGVVEHPTWDDFTWFLESRCFPKTRDHAKDILKEMGLPFYDPLLIIEKTDGRMAGDEQWILILKNKEARHGTSGKSVISGTNPTIWDMRDSRRHWCLIYCKKALFPTRLSCISLFGLHTAALSAVAVPVLIF